MRLTKIIIEGFRSFGEKQTITFGDLTAFIGENSSGKTAALSAIGKIFGQRQADRQLSRSDFHLPVGKKPEDVEELQMSIEAIFEFDELGEANSNDIVGVFYDYLTINGPAKTPIVRIRLSAKWSKSANADGSIDSEIMFIGCGEGESETKENHIPARRQVLDSIRMIYVPAIRNPKAELKPNSGTIMSGLIGSVSWSEDRKNAINEKISEISNAVLEEPGTKAIDASLHRAWRDLDGDDRYENARLVFGGGNFETVVNHPAVAFSPTPEEREYEVDELGDGLRSLFYFSMVKGLVELEEKIRIGDNGIEECFETVLPTHTILAVEEPENHIAPHLLGKLLAELKEIGEREHCQVIVTSHSPAIVGRVSPRDIRHFRMTRETKSTICKHLTLPVNENADTYKYIRESLAAYPEVLFAKAVILGEGSSEEVVLPRVIKAIYRQADSAGVSIAPLGGRHVNHFWRLLNDLQIPYVTLLDLDLERFGGGWGRIKYAASMLEEFKQDETFDWPGGITKDSTEFQNLGKRNNDDSELDEWIEYLETKGVFFSNPLDLDFAMLCSFPCEYIATLGSDAIKKWNGTMGSPKGEEQEEDTKEALEYVLHSGKHGSGSEGITYTEEQKSLMPYYKKLFLGSRGKPSTHILALIEIDDEAFKAQMPEVLKRLTQTVHNFISDPLER